MHGFILLATSAPPGNYHVPRDENRIKEVFELLLVARAILIARNISIARDENPLFICLFISAET